MKSENVPALPDLYYADCWRGYGAWLGTGRDDSADRAHRPFGEARIFARKLGLRGEEEWFEWSARGRAGLSPRPPDIPGFPVRAYEEDGPSGA